MNENVIKTKLVAYTSGKYNFRVENDFVLL